MHGHTLVRSLCACLWLALASGMPAARAGAQETPAAPGAPRDDEIAALKKQVADQNEMIRKLLERVERLEKTHGGAPSDKPADEPDIPPVEIPSGPAQPAPSAPGGTAARASLLPDISVIGNNIGRFLSVRGDPDRNRLQLGEFEIGLQQPIYPGIRFDAFLAAGADDNFQVAAEEVYATFANIGHLPFGGILGRKRLDFGKVNPVHPHARPYVDQPAVLANLLDPDSLNGNGASLNVNLPVRGLFANAEIGLFHLQPSDAGLLLEPAGPATRARRQAGAFYPAGAGIAGNFPMARLWTSRALGQAGELEIGGSYGFGRGENGDNINLTGLDLTYRRFPGPFRRLMLQGEVFWHHRRDSLFGTGGHTRSGHYALLTWKPDQYTEYGLRYDNSRYPWPLPGRDQSVSLIWTDRLTEVTLLRLQYRYGDRTGDVFLPARRGYNELYLQFLWGGGAHTHALQ